MKPVRARDVAQGDEFLAAISKGSNGSIAIYVCAPAAAAAAGAAGVRVLVSNSSAAATPRSIPAMPLGSAYGSGALAHTLQWWRAELPSNLMIRSRSSDEPPPPPPPPSAFLAPASSSSPPPRMLISSDVAGGVDVEVSFGAGNGRQGGLLPSLHATVVAPPTNDDNESSDSSNHNPVVALVGLVTPW